MTLFNADDYGVCVAQCENIRACRRDGVLTGVSAMPNSPYLKTAMADIANDPGLTVAVHLNFTEGLCLSTPAEVSLLVGENGRFRQSFFSLFLLSLGPKRKALKAQLKREIRAQIGRVMPLLAGRALRLDGHQHIQMVPVVMDALRDVVKEDGLRPEYIRWSCEPLGPYLKNLSLWRDYGLVNLVKNVVLNVFGWLDRGYIRDLGLERNMILGLVISGNLEYRLISRLLPDFQKAAARRGVDLELVMHPGWGFGPGDSLDVPGGPFESFNTDEGRKREYDCLFLLEEYLR